MNKSEMLTALARELALHDARATTVGNLPFVSRALARSLIDGVGRRLFAYPHGNVAIDAHCRACDEFTAKRDQREIASADERGNWHFRRGTRRDYQVSAQRWKNARSCGIGIARYTAIIESDGDSGDFLDRAIRSLDRETVGRV